MQKELLQYQSLDMELRKIKRELANNPARLEGMQQKKTAQEAENALTKLDARSAEMQNAVKGIQQARQEIATLMQEYDKALKEVDDEKELNYLIKKMSTLEEQLKSAEQECQAILKEAETMETRYKQLVSVMADAVKKMKQCTIDFKEEGKKVEPKVNELMKQKHELEPKLDKQQLDEYNQMFEQNIFPVLVPLKDNQRCGGCQMDLSSGSIATLKDKGKVKCEHCRRIVYAVE